MVSKKKTGKKVKTLPTKPLSNQESKTVKGGGFSIGGIFKGLPKTAAPVVPSGIVPPGVVK